MYTSIAASLVSAGSQSVRFRKAYDNKGYVHTEAKYDRHLGSDLRWLARYHNSIHVRIEATGIDIIETKTCGLLQGDVQLLGRL